MFSILANLIGIYGLIVLPFLSSQSIDVSNWLTGGTVAISVKANENNAPTRRDNNSLGMVVTAGSAIIADKKTGEILWEKNANEIRPLASITKLVALLVFLDRGIDWNKEVTIQKSDFREGGRIRLYQGEVITVRDLFNAALVASSNVAVMALAHTSGLAEEEFVKSMNVKAKDFGMDNSVFVEPTGLSPDNKTTARDIIKLAQAAFSRPIIQQATVQEKYSVTILNKNRQEIFDNTNKLLKSYLTIVAGKTGYLEEAGYCLVSEVKGPQNQAVIIAVLSSASEIDRFQDLKALAQWSFDNYVWE